MRALQKIRIRGFKSIADAELTLGELNVVIGANGSGKSNLIGAFRLLERVLSKNLQAHVASEPDRFLYHGRKVTPQLSFDLTFDRYAYGFTLEASQATLVFAEERAAFAEVFRYDQPIARGHKESYLETAVAEQASPIPDDVFPNVKNLVVYHFHDTSDSCSRLRPRSPRFCSPPNPSPCSIISHPMR